MRLIINARHVVCIAGRWYRLFRLECGHTKLARSYASTAKVAGTFIDCGACKGVHYSAE